MLEQSSKTSDNGSLHKQNHVDVAHNAAQKMLQCVELHNKSTARDGDDNTINDSAVISDKMSVDNASQIKIVNHKILELVSANKSIPDSLKQTAIDLHVDSRGQNNDDKSGDVDARFKDVRDIQSEQAVINSDRQLMQFANVSQSMKSAKAEPVKVAESSPSWGQRALDLASTGLHDVQQECHDHPFISTMVVSLVALRALRVAGKLAEGIAPKLPGMSIAAASESEAAESEAVRVTDLGGRVSANELNSLYPKTGFSMPSTRVVAADGAHETVAETAGRSRAVEELIGRSAAAEAQKAPILSLGEEFTVGDVNRYYAQRGLSAPTIKSISVDAGRLSEADTENTLLTLRDDAYPLSPKFDPSSSSIDWGGPPPNGFSKAARQALRKALSEAANVVKE